MFSIIIFFLFFLIYFGRFLYVIFGRNFGKKLIQQKQAFLNANYSRNVKLKGIK